MAGLGTAALAIVFSGISRIMGNSANGNAVDALNYYNDAVGSIGGNCDNPPPPMPEPGQQIVPVPKVGPAARPKLHAPRAWSEMDQAEVGTVSEIPR